MTLVQMACSMGINEAVRAEVLDPTQAAVNLENVRQFLRGVYDKRYGFGARSAVRSDGTTRTTAYRLLSYDGLPCVIDGHQMDTWSLVASQDIPRSRVPECTAQRRPIVSRQALLSPFGTTDRGDVTSAVQNDVAYAGGYYVTVFEEQIDATHMQLTAVVSDQQTGATVATMLVTGSNTTVSPTNVQIVSVGTNVVVIWDSGANVLGSRLSVASQSSIQAGFATQVTLANDLGGNFSMAACGLTTKAVIAYNNTNAATARVTVKSFDPTTNALTNLQTATPTTVNSTVSGVHVDGDEADTLWVTWRAAGATYIEARSPANITTVTGTSTALSTAGSGQIRLVIGVTGTAQASVAWAEGDGTNAGWYVLRCSVMAVVAGAVTLVTNASNKIYGFIPASKPFVVGGRTYIEAFHDDTASTAAVLFDITTATSGGIRPVAWTAPRLISMSTSFVAPRHVVKVSATKFATIQSVATNAVSGGLNVIEWDFADPRRWAPVTAAGCLLLGGGMPSVFDGYSINELGFLVPPKVVAAVGGAGTPNGTYNYTALYEYVDAKGNVVWSDMAPVQVVTATNQFINVNVRTITATWKAGKDGGILTPAGLRNVRIKLYRTANGGGLFYLLKAIINDPASAFVTVQDNTADATLISGAQPYRSPGVQGAAQPRQCPPCMFAWCAYNGMIVGIGDDLLTIWYTPQHVSGEAIYFSDIFQFPLEQDGPCTAISAQDGTCFVWKRRAIYAGAGEPASDNGTSGGFGTFRKLACDVGCIEPRSVVVTAKGIFFQSERGIELLSRAQSVEFIGEAVRQTTTAFPVCVSATLDSGQNRVYFEMAASESANQVSGSGRTLVYNLALEVWESKDRRYNNAGMADTPAQSSALIYTGSAWRYAWLGTDGIVYVEDQTTYLDPGSLYVQKLAETGHVKLGGLQGSQQVNAAKLLAKNITAHNLNWALRYDYDGYQTTQTHTDAQIGAIGLPNEQLEIRPDDNAPCEAVGLKVWDAAPTGGGSVGIGQGGQWLGLLFDIDPSEGSYDLPDTAR